VPQCEECKNNLAKLDDAVNVYFRSGAGIHLDKVERSIAKTNNKGINARKINLNCNEDYAQSNGALLFWLRKLLVGLWYKYKNTYFDGEMIILAPWVTFDVPEIFVSGYATKPNELWAILFNIDIVITGSDYKKDCEEKTPFSFTFIPEYENVVPTPLQLLRFAIFGCFSGYCLYIPNTPMPSSSIISNMFGKAPLCIERWLKSPYLTSPTVAELVNEHKSISAYEATNRVRV
jgi:hypothetical protein